MAISIGNTNITFGFYTDDLKSVASDRIPNLNIKGLLKKPKAGSGFSKIVSSVKRVLIVSTNPAIEKVVSRWVKDIFDVKPLIFRKDFTVPMPILVKEPAKVGGDRLLNAFAAYKMANSTAIAIDFGTAITFNVVSGKGEFLGGMIVPGFNSMAKALHEYCALLPLVKPKVAHQAIGKNTEEAINSGIYLGITGLVTHLIEKITKELDKKPKIIGTGGDIGFIKGQLPIIDEFIPDLTLIGLIQAYMESKK
jgi:type III pantothenate kinase